MKWGGGGRSESPQTPSFTWVKSVLPPLTADGWSQSWVGHQSLFRPDASYHNRLQYASALVEWFSTFFLMITGPYSMKTVECREWYCYLPTLLQIRIRDPVPFWPLDPDLGSGIGFFRIPYPKPIFWELTDKFLSKKFYNSYSLKTGPNFFLQHFKNKIISFLWNLWLQKKVW